MSGERRRLMASGGGGDLPSGYIRARYIKCPIDSQGPRIITNISITESDNLVVTGDFNFGGIRYLSMGWDWGGQFEYNTNNQINNGSAQKSVNIGNYQTKFRFEILSGTSGLSVGSIEYNNITESIQRTHPNLYLHYPINFCFFVKKSDGVISGQPFAAQQTLSNPKLYKNGIIVFNGIACKNQSDVAGFYDAVSKTFYTTPVGTLYAVL